MKPGILFFSFDYPPVGGGISRYVDSIVQELRGRGLETVVVTGGQGKDETGSTIHCQGRRPWRELKAFLVLRRLARLRAPVFCSIWYPEALLALLAGCRTVIVFGLGSEMMPYRGLFRRVVWSTLRRFVLRRCSAAVAISRYTAWRMKEAAGIDPIVQPLAVDIKKFSPGNRDLARANLKISRDALVVSTVARLTTHKGHETVFHAISQLSPTVRESLVFLVAGEGPNSRHLVDAAERIGVTANVRWLGNVDEGVLPDVYRASNTVLLCSEEDRVRCRVEGFGLALLEAQACGIPVVGTRVGGIPDALGDTGLLIDEGDFSALRRIMESIASDPDSFAERGRLSRTRVERDATWAVCVDQLARALGNRNIQVGL